MNGKKIIIIDKDYDSTGKIKDSLVENGFSVNIIRADDFMNLNPDEDAPDLVIYITGISGTIKSETWKTTADICRKADIPIGLPVQRN